MYVLLKHRTQNKDTTQPQYLKSYYEYLITSNMFIAFYRQFRQGIYVAGCAAASFTTLGVMLSHCNKMEKKRIRNKYENQIKVLTNEIKVLKGE
jgi:hypothetical protein